jgi:hypothetical protein
MLIRFITAKFDVSVERRNPINPIPGESLLLWLADKASPKAAVSVPRAEDWGWYSLVEWSGRQYMLGSSASPEGDEYEWVLQIDKHRSLVEKLLGRERMLIDDPCARFFQQLLEEEPSFKGVVVDPAR